MGDGSDQGQGGVSVGGDVWKSLDLEFPKMKSIQVLRMEICHVQHAGKCVNLRNTRKNTFLQWKAVMPKMLALFGGISDHLSYG